MARFLVISLVDPDSHPGGAGTYTRGLLNTLRKGEAEHEVHLLAPLHAPPGPWKRTRQLVALARSLLSRFPAKVLFARQHEFQVRIRNTIRAHHFDAVLINGSDMLWAMDELPEDLSSVLIVHNQEHQILTQQLAGYRVLPRMFHREISKQRRFAIESFRRVQGLIFLSLADLTWACAQVTGLRALHVPPLFAEPLLSRRRKANGTLRLGFLADFAWWPNRQNWEGLVNEILPYVIRPVAVHVYGRHSEKLSRHHQVVFHGLVHDLKVVWDEVDIMICPIRAGAGVSIKLAESLYHRMPVLATTLAIRGIACSTGSGLEIMYSAEEWITFLNSSKVDVLATQIPSEELYLQFTVDRYRAQLEQFIMGIALDGRAA